MAPFPNTSILNLPDYGFLQGQLRLRVHCSVCQTLLFVRQSPLSGRSLGLPLARWVEQHRLSQPYIRPLQFPRQALYVVASSHGSIS